MYWWQPCSSPRNVTRRLQFFVKTVPLEDEEKRAKVYKLFKKEHLIYAQLFAQFESKIYFDINFNFIHFYN